MPELTEQEKLERRREKRKQKILASAENRLNRITGTAFPNRASPTPSPSTSTSSLARSDRRSPSPSPAVFMASSTSTDTLRSRKRLSSIDHSAVAAAAAAAAAAASADPSDAVGAPPLSFLSTPPPAPILEASLSSSSYSSYSSLMHHHYPPTTGSPLPPSLEAMLSGASTAGAGAGASGEQQPLPNLNDLFGGQFPFNPALLATLQQQQQETVPEQANTNKYWDLLHFVSMLWLGFYAVYTEWCTGGKERFASLLFADHSDYPDVRFPLFWYFATIELLLQSGRMVYQKGNTSSSSFILTAIIQYLPPQLGNAVNVLMRYWVIFSCLVKDAFVLVFIIGLAEIISAVMV